MRIYKNKIINTLHDSNLETFLEKIGIFDTKPKNDRIEDQRVKGEALQRYIKEQNKKGKKLFGGLIIKDGSHYKINQKEKFKSFVEDSSDWEVLEF